MSNQSVMLEALEGRRLMSATLAPSAVEGNYSGTATDTAGSTIALKLTVSATKETLTIVGYGSESVSLSASAFKKLRQGTFSYSGKIKAITVNISGKVKEGGKELTGSGKLKGKTTVSGTFVLTK